jgi:hypothetical protein
MIRKIIIEPIIIVEINDNTSTIAEINDTTSTQVNVLLF